MNKVVNLTKARKARDRAADKAGAAANRAAHGRTKLERKAAEAEADDAARKLDAHRREPSEPEPER